MGLSRMRLGELLTPIERPNVEGAYGLDDVRGVNNQKLMIRTKADVSKRDFTKFQIVMPGEFFFNHRTSRNGSKFSITYNYDDVSHIVTEDYVLFHVTDEDVLCPGWLYLYVCRAEYDRYVIQNSWGSSTEFFNWEDLCDTEIDLPPIDVQRKYVAIYESMLANQRAYESGLDDLKLTCDAILDKCKKSQQIRTLAQLANVIDNRNESGSCKRASGIRVGQGFIPAVASSEDVSKYKLVEPGQIACNLLHVGRDAAFPIAINHTSSVLAVSPAYTVLMPKDMAIGDYLVSWFSRHETGRYGWFVSDDNIRSGMSIDRFLGLPIPMPEQSLLDALIGVADALRIRATINERLKAQLKDICPVLIRGSIEESEG